MSEQRQSLQIYVAVIGAIGTIMAAILNGPLLGKIIPTAQLKETRKTYPIIANLTSQVGNNSAPAFSPDQKKIVFVSNRNGNPDIYTVNSGGTEPTQLTNTPGIAEDVPSFSPDGTKIIFGAFDGKNGEIFLMNADGSQQKNISNAPESAEGRPSFSPSGQFVVFDSNRTGNFEVFRARLQNDSFTDIEQMTDRPDFNDRKPSFSAGDSSIVFRSETVGKGLDSSRIFLLDTNTKDLSELSTDDSDFYPAMSQNGKWIAFVSTRSGNPDIYAMKADKSETIRLTDNPAVDGEPAFSADGRRIVFVSKRYGTNADVLVLRFLK